MGRVNSDYSRLAALKGRLIEQKIPDKNAPKLPERLAKREKAATESSSLRELLRSASGGKVQKSKAGIHIPGGHLSPRLFEGSKVLNSRGKAGKEVAFRNGDFGTEKSLGSGCGKNLMGKVLTRKGESMILTRDGKLIPVQEQTIPQTKMDSEKLRKKMAEKFKYNCLTCIKFMQSESAAKEHQAKQVKMCFVGQAGKRQRMQLKPTTCKVVRERVFSDEEIRQKVDEMYSFPSS